MKQLAMLTLSCCLAAAAQEPAETSRTAPAKSPKEDVVDRARVILEEARAAKDQGDPEAARSRVRQSIMLLLEVEDADETTDWIDLLISAAHFANDAGDLRTAEQGRLRVLDVRSRTLPDDHPDLQSARGNLAMTMFSLGDLRGARALQEKVLEVLSRMLPDDHPDLQRARNNLAGTIRTLGDLQGARALQEKVLEVLSRTLPDDHSDLQRARNNLAGTIGVLGDLQGAWTLQEKVLDVWSRTLPDDHPDLQRARNDLALTIRMLGDLQGARTLQEKVLEVRSRTLLDDHPDLQTARASLAGTIGALGDLQGARALFEKVLEVRSRTLPDDHPDLQRARLNLAGTIRILGDLPGARALFEKVLEVLSRTLPDDHPDLQGARGNLALTIRMLGDLQGARALQEKVLEVLSRTLPDDHSNLHGARGNLAATIRMLGDLQGARALEEKVLEVFVRTLPDDHPDLQAARNNLALTMFSLGDLQGAWALQEKVLEVRSRTLPGDHPDLQAARNNLAATIGDLGDLQGARALQEKIFEERSRTLPDDHPDLQLARLNLAVTIRDLGDLPGARALLEKILEVFVRTLPDDHPNLQRARENLARTLAAERAAERGEEEARKEKEEERREEFTALAEAYTRASARRARRALLDTSSREAEERCAALSDAVGLAMSFAAGMGVFAKDALLEREAFILSETARGAALVSARLVRRALEDEELAGLRTALREASAELSRLVQAGGSPDAYAAVTTRRDDLQRDLIRRAARSEVEAGLLDLDPESVAGRIDQAGALIAYRRHHRHEFPPGRTEASSRTSLCAFVVRRAGEGRETLRWIDLGALEPIEIAARDWRDRLGAPIERGRPAETRQSVEDREDSAGVALRRLVFDPLLPALEGAERLVVVLDDVLHTIPFDALPAGGEPGRSDRSARPDLLGEQYVIEQRGSALELLLEDDPLAGGETLLALGGASFDSEPVGPEAGAIALLEHEAQAAEVASYLRGSAWERGFDPLPSTRSEVRALAERFEEVLGESVRAVVLDRRAASLESIEQLSPGARWLHLATHGWFARESIRSWEDPRPLDGRSGPGFRMSAEDHVTGSSPMVLCGLALSGANLPADALGRYPGLVTAEEMSTWDLRNCELAVLSACDTNVGIRRAGQGVASLQRALHMAGARSVITSLWKVPDEATKELMLDFYRRLWVEKKPKRQALWEAKMRLRNARDAAGRAEYTTRDWASWVLTGDPE